MAQVAGIGPARGEVAKETGSLRKPGVLTAERLPLAGFLAVQAFLGYEWFISGLTKIVRGGFPAGLADELTEKSEGTVDWYANFLDSVVIPHGKLFGYVIEVGEVLVGLALIAAAVLWLVRWPQLGRSLRLTTLAAIFVASLAGVFMNVNFHLANASAHPWLLPGNGFDEGVDLDSLMPAIELTTAAVTAGLLVSLRRDRHDPDDAG